MLNEAPAPSGPAWTVDHPVLVELRKRRGEGSRPRDRRAADNPVKIGLAVEGGGMRGVVSGGMLYALEDLGLTRAFDAVYGMSSGAINAAYFLLGESWLPLSIYYDDLTTKRFIDFARPLRAQSIMDLDYVFDEVIVRRKPLDLDGVLASDVPLHVGITFVDKLQTVLVRDFTDPDDLRDALRATMWLPGAVQGTTTFRGDRALDGGVLTAHPYALAAADGCTHVLSLSTHQIHAPRNYNPVALRFAYRYLERLCAGLGDGYLQSIEDNQCQLVQLAESMVAPTPDPYVLDLGPLPNAPLVKRHETDAGRLIHAARYSYELMYCAIQGHPVSTMGATGVRAVPQFTIVES
jgi:predicted patatin/cPLA2 family phospholipase